MSRQNNGANNENSRENRSSIWSLKDPLAIFLECHKQIRVVCTNLETLAEHLVENELSDSNSNSNSNSNSDSNCAQAHTIVQFFDVDARQHHEDEERDFFPMLLALKTSDAEKAELKKMIALLAENHSVLARVWGPLRGALMRIADGQSQRHNFDFQTFVTMHQHHMNREDTSVLVYAKKYFDQRALNALREAILQRRNAH